MSGVRSIGGELSPVKAKYEKGSAFKGEMVMSNDEK